MDLDKDTTVNRTEVAAWFKRNEYIICRPFRSQVIKKLKEIETIAASDIFKFFDANNDSRIDGGDVSQAIAKLDTNLDGVISHGELMPKVHKMVAPKCRETAKADRKAWEER